MSGNTNIIETRDICMTFGRGDAEVRALIDINIEIKKGEFVAIMGPSGSGKSTLMNIIGCLLRPVSGKLIMDGEDISDLDAYDRALLRNEKIGFVFQSYNLLPRTSALRNVLLPLIYDRENELSRDEMEELAEEMLVVVGLGDRLNHNPNELSGGQQQRVAIARALIKDPVLLIADEPTGNLDSKSGEEIMNLIHEMNERGMSIVMVTHDEEIAEHSSRVIHLMDGQIEQVVNNGKHLKKMGVAQ
ncbi:MAG: ABC transporter ATP-binding protein [Anaerolineaceae bacterium]|nr:ABC transporter ATP-binding protein [Anaerolineaceae bacterium]